MEIVSIARLLLGTIVLLYVSNCWLNQRFWSRKHFSWKLREYWPEVFWFNIILGTIMGAYMISSVVL